jgi:glycosyltransferase involved in cell wall biosynthesis
LQDLENQTIADKTEIIIVNSGSQQNESKIVQDLQKRYKNIIYIETPERESIYAAWNRGIKAASGKYITNANSDDRHRKDAFEIMANTLEINNDIDIVYPSFRITHEENETFKNSTASEFYEPPDYNRHELLFRCLPGHFPMWRKSVHDVYGFFNESYQVAGDHEFWLRISESCNFFHIKEYLGLYYHNPQGGEHRDPIQTKIETINVVNHYIDWRFLPQHRTNRELTKKIRKKQSDLSFWAADFFFSKNRPELTKRYVLKSLSYRSNYFKNYKLLLYCFSPKVLVNLISSIRNANRISIS